MPYLFALIHALIKTKEGKKNFVWFHVESSEQKEECESLCKGYELDILPSVNYFVLACRKEMPDVVRQKIILHCLPSETEENAIYVGKQFGYADKEIKWYLGQLKLANKIRNEIKAKK